MILNDTDVAPSLLNTLHVYSLLFTEFSQSNVRCPVIYEILYIACLSHATPKSGIRGEIGLLFCFLIPYYSLNDIFVLE